MLRYRPATAEAKIVEGAPKDKHEQVQVQEQVHAG